MQRLVSLSASIGALIALVTASVPAQAGEEVHFEVTTGFRISQHDYTGVPFALEGGGAGLGHLGTAALTGDDLRGATALGARVAMRLGLHPFRLGLGFDLPGAANVPRRVVRAGPEDAHELMVERVGHWGVEVTLGGEIPFNAWDESGAVYLDLVGAFHMIEARVLIDGEGAVYRANTFDPSLRVGVRVPVRSWLFVNVAAEVGLGGDTIWGAELGIGVGAF